MDASGKNDANDEQLTFVAYTFKINIDDLHDIIDITERPRYNFDRIRKNQQLLLRGCRKGVVEPSIATIDAPVTFPVGIFLTPVGQIVTVHYDEVISFSGIIDALNKKKTVSEPIFLFLELVQETFSRLDKVSYDFAKKITSVQKTIVQMPRDLKRLNEPFLLNSYLINFRSAVQGNFNAFQSFMNKNKALFEATPELYEKVDDIRIDIEQIVQFSDIYQGQVKNLTEQMTAIANNSLNHILKVVGSISLIVSIPTLIGSYYGMNVALPGDVSGSPVDHTWVFFFIIGLSFSVSVLVWVIFRRLKWL